MSSLELYKERNNEIGKSDKSDSIVFLNNNRDTNLICSERSLVTKNGEKQLLRPSKEEEFNIYEKTKKALDTELNRKQNSLLPFKEISNGGKTEYIRYKSKEDTIGYDPRFSERIIKIVEKPKDPLELPKFKNRNLASVKKTEMVPILRSAPKKLTQEEIKEWNIPPSVSNWKNPMGYTIPINMRVQADTRDLINYTVNERFSSLSETLYLAECNAREQIKLRNELLKQKKIREEIEREEKLRKLAEASRYERNNIIGTKSSSRKDDDIIDGNIVDNIDYIKKIEIDKRREIEREFRKERAGKKSKTLRDEDRDISEHIALGQSNPYVSNEVEYDARLFNKTSGLDSGFGNETLDEYDRPLFNRVKKPSGLYTFEESRVEGNIGGRVHVPSFSGAQGLPSSNNQGRSRPVLFEKDEDDPFGLDRLIDSVSNESKTNNKRNNS
ncbi:hypothetical protein FG379_000805 [Cryptosporidium bovis]|uniref:uncharacterized protein n=1 Tax=Cryptosporidium bovis TaxID=310047 RepID=UPI00351A5D6F|nr:hypothetical protein FG379_000805 [Cryptosporidium bovis]